MVRVLFVVGGTVVGLLGTALCAARVRELPVAEAVASEPVSMFAGILAGALVGQALWLFSHPRSLGRLARVMIVVNCAAWLLFLSANRRIDDVGGDLVLRERADRDAQAALGWPEGMAIVSDPPALLAGRRLTWAGLSEKPLGLLAGPAIVFVEAHVVPERYVQTGPTISESYWVAAIALGLSIAWWATVPSLWSWLKKPRWFATTSGA
jgi:hypothetical protein